MRYIFNNIDLQDFLVNIDCRTPDLLNYVRQRLEIEPSGLYL